MREEEKEEGVAGEEPQREEPSPAEPTFQSNTENGRTNKTELFGLKQVFVFAS